MKRRKIDIIGAPVTDRDNPSAIPNRLVLNAAEIGAGAEISDRSKKVREKVKSRPLSTMAGIVSILPTYESNLCDIIIDSEKKISTKVTLGIVANGNFLGGGFNAAPRANIADRLLDLVILKNSGSFKTLDKFVQLKGDSEYSEEDDILYYQATTVTFIPNERDVTVSLDGEPVGILSATFKIYHNALTVRT